MDQWQVEDRKILHTNPFASMVVETLARGEQTMPYYVLDYPRNAVATVAVTDDRQLVLLREYRHPVGRIIFDLPGGQADESEDPVQSALRELEEETGYRAGHIEPLGAFNPLAGSLRLTLYLFFANQLSPGRQALDEREEVEVQLVPVSEVYQNVVNSMYV